MPTFKLEEMDENSPYGGDNDMYFRQWRLPSMKSVLDEKLDRDFLNAVKENEEMARKRKERRQKHSEEYDKKFQNLIKTMKKASLANERKETIPFLKEPTQSELNNAREELEKEFASPSSTARMVPFAEKIRPRPNPTFGEKMVGLKNLVLPPPTKSTPSSTNIPLSAETVFFPQTHDSFNLDSYNGSRPSFAFSGINGATSTPVSKGNFFGDIAEEAGDDSVFEESKYITAMESPVQKTNEAKTKRKKEIMKSSGPTPMTEKPEDKQKGFLMGPIHEAHTEKVSDQIARPEIDINRNPNRLGIGFTSKPTENIELTSLLGVSTAQTESKEQEKVGLSSLVEKNTDCGANSTEQHNSKDHAVYLPQNNQKAHVTSPSLHSKRSESRTPPCISSPIELHSSEEKKTTDSVYQPDAQKIPAPPYVQFRNYINLLSTLLEEKCSFEKSSDPQFRAVLKRTITEKMTLLTQRQASPEAKNKIVEYFKALFQKKEVLGFTISGNAPTLHLQSEEEVFYSVQCVIENYIALAELDEELIPTICALISSLSMAVRRVEKVFIVLMFNKSTLLRQNPDECIRKFVNCSTAQNVEQKAIEWNQERALVTLFFSVFTKSAYTSTRGRRMVLSEELLWKYVESTVAHVHEVPKASFILLQLITTCKSQLSVNKERWTDLLVTIESDKLPKLEKEPFSGDESIVSQLRQILRVLNN
uniref:Nuclear pore complex protein Nup50 n=1 Tax=Caenorhabditis tropicalis TaxID=1561998 RepID=A0A1I7TPS5_9PELO